MTPLGQALKSKKFRKLYVQLLRDGRFRSPNASTKPIAEVHYTIHDRAWCREQLDKYWRDGKIGLHRSGMDCDCTQYSYSMVVEMPNSAFMMCRDETRHHEFLDGPESTRWSLASEVTPHSASRDLALMAYEDGHPSTVYLVSESELIPD